MMIICPICKKKDDLIGLHFLEEHEYFYHKLNEKAMKDGYSSNMVGTWMNDMSQDQVEIEILLCLL